MAHSSKLTNDFNNTNVQKEGRNEETSKENHEGLFFGFFGVGGFGVEGSCIEGDFSLEELDNKKKTRSKNGQFFHNQFGEGKVAMKDLTREIQKRVVSREDTKGCSCNIGSVVEEIAKGKRDTEEGEVVEAFSSVRIVVVINVEVVVGHIQKVGSD